MCTSFLFFFSSSRKVGIPSIDFVSAIQVRTNKKEILPELHNTTQPTQWDETIYEKNFLRPVYVSDTCTDCI